MNFFDDVLGSSGWPSYGRRSPYDKPYAPRTVNRPVSHPTKREEVSQPKSTRVIPVSGPPSPRKPNKYVENHDGAALKIQSVYRGYTVRRATPLVHLRKVFEVKTKLAVYKEQVSDSEKVRFIRENHKEQLALSEGVMKLVLQLDDIQGALPVVREIRKEAVKDAMQFLEKVDSLLKGQESAAEETVAEERIGEECEEKGGSVDMDTTVEGGSQTEDMCEWEMVEDDKGDGSDVVGTDKTRENEERAEGHTENVERTESVEEQAQNEMQEAEEDPESDNEAEEQREPMIEDTTDEHKGDLEEETKRIVHTMVEDAVNNVKRKREGEEEEEAAERMDKLVKKLLDDNAQLKTLVAQCIKQNEIQNALIYMLNDRVQKLEKKAKKGSSKKIEQL